MKTLTVWNEKMLFTGEADGRKVAMDAKAPIGGGSAPTPKELVALGVSGCTAMDVVALLRKYKQPLESLEVDADVAMTEGAYPVVFKEIRLTFRLKGALDAEKVKEAVQLSQTKFCGVSAMIAKACPITYTIQLNGQEIGSGKAEF